MKGTLPSGKLWDAYNTLFNINSTLQRLIADESPVDLDGLNGPAALALSPGGEDIYVVSPFDDAVAAFATG